MEKAEVHAPHGIYKPVGATEWGEKPGGHERSHLKGKWTLFSESLWSVNTAVIPHVSIRFPVSLIACYL